MRNGTSSYSWRGVVSTRMRRRSCLLHSRNMNCIVLAGFLYNVLVHFVLWTRSNLQTRRLVENLLLTKGRYHILSIGSKHYSVAHKSGNRSGRSFVRPLSPLHAMQPHPDYGLIRFTSIASRRPFQRTIRPDDANLYEEERAHVFEVDAIQRDEEAFWGYENEYDGLKPDASRKPLWSLTMKPNCNSFHEQSWSENDLVSNITYLNSGYYRMSFMVSDSYVIKRQRFIRNFNRHRLQKIITEAAIFERLAQSPHITTSYGHCAFSLMVENAPFGLSKIVTPRQYFMKKPGQMPQSKLNKMQQRRVLPLNSLKPQEKLDLVIQLAKSLCEIHGLETGPIWLGDLSLDQWLKTEDKRIVLNDFDNAEVLSSGQRCSHYYCPHLTGSVGGLQAPEEVQVGNVTEAADVWKFGGLVYSVLTGLEPYYDDLFHERKEEVKSKVLEGTAPYIDPRYRARSFIERRLVEIMDQCYRREPTERPSIFDILHQLRDTKHRYDAGESLKLV